MHYLPTETAISTAFPWPGSVSAALCYANCRTLKKLWESGKWERKRDRWLNVLCAGESGCYCLCLSPTTSSGRLTTMLLHHVRCPKWHSRSFTANQIRQSKDALNKLLSHEKMQLYCQCRWSVTDRPFFSLVISHKHRLARSLSFCLSPLFLPLLSVRSLQSVDFYRLIIWAAKLFKS